MSNFVFLEALVLLAQITRLCQFWGCFWENAGLWTKTGEPGGKTWCQLGLLSRRALQLSFPPGLFWKWTWAGKPAMKVCSFSPCPPLASSFFTLTTLVHCQPSILACLVAVTSRTVSLLHWPWSSRSCFELCPSLSSRKLYSRGWE